MEFKKRIKIAKKDHEITYFKFQPEYKEVWDKLCHEKLIVREIAKDLTCIYDPGIYTNLTGLYFLIIPSFNTNDYFCLLTLLNSTLIDVVFKTLYGTLHMSGNYLRFNGSFIKSIPTPKRFPLTISYTGKILQFLSQLKYENRQGLSNPVENRFNLSTISKYLTFYEDISNSLVKQLYLRLERYNELDILLSSPYLIPNIEFKFMNSLFDLPKYISYSKGEIEHHLTQIDRNFEVLNKNTKLIRELKNISETLF